MTTGSYVGAGAAVTGNNASLNPALPSGLVAGDLVLIVASIRNSGTGTVNTPANWQVAYSSGNVAVLGRIYFAGMAAPTITFAGGVANADTMARAFALRGVAPQVVASIFTSLLNGSAQNIGGPAYTNVKGMNVIVAWKQDDATAYTTPSGWTQIGLTSTTTGDDASMAIYYIADGSGGDSSWSTITVTGGVAAISRALQMGFPNGADIAVQALDTFPPRTQVTVSNLRLGDDVTVYRVVAGQRTPLRVGSASNVTDTAFLVIDGELPFGVPVSYLAVVNDSAEYSTSDTTYDLPGGKVVLTDAITGIACETVIRDWDEKGYDRQASVYRAGGRNVVVSGVLGGFTATIELYFDAYSGTEQFKELWANATQNVVQIRRPTDDYDGIDCYVSILSARENRTWDNHTRPDRSWFIDVVEVDSWASTLEAVGFTYGDLESFYAGQTYADLAGDFATYLLLEQGDFSA